MKINNLYVGDVNFDETKEILISTRGYKLTWKRIKHGVILFDLLNEKKNICK